MNNPDAEVRIATAKTRLSDQQDVNVGVYLSARSAQAIEAIFDDAEKSRQSLRLIVSDVNGDFNLVAPQGPKHYFAFIGTLATERDKTAILKKVGVDAPAVILTCGKDEGENIYILHQRPGEEHPELKVRCKVLYPPHL